MPRIKIETLVPAGTEVDLARASARLAAAEQLGIHIVEETIIPVISNSATVDTDGTTAILAPSPNDHTVDRILTTWWDHISTIASGQ